LPAKRVVHLSCRVHHQKLYQASETLSVLLLIRGSASAHLFPTHTPTGHISKVQRQPDSSAAAHLLHFSPSADRTNVPQETAAAGISTLGFAVLRFDLLTANSKLYYKLSGLIYSKYFCQPFYLEYRPGSLVNEK